MRSVVVVGERETHTKIELTAAVRPGKPAMARPYFSGLSPLWNQGGVAFFIFGCAEFKSR